MKAKAYFERYVNEFPDKSNDWKVIKTFRDIFCEAQEIAKNRNAKTDESYRSIFKELNQKSNSFIRMVNEIDGGKWPENSFMEFVKIENPKFYSLIFTE